MSGKRAAGIIGDGFWVNSCCRATSQDPASLRLTLNSTPAARQGNKSRRCRDTDLTHDENMLSFTHPFKNHRVMDCMSGNILLQSPPSGMISSVCVCVTSISGKLQPSFPAVFIENQYFMLFTAAFVNMSAASMEKVQASNISNNSGSLMSQWKCGLYTFRKGLIQRLFKTWRKNTPKLQLK